MSTTIKQVESPPEAYPEIGSPPFVTLSAAASELDPAMLWARIESHIAHRFTPRDVVWIVEGPGEWTPPLTPAAVDTIEVWRGESWVETLDVAGSPCGGFTLPGDGPYRVTATVGDGSPFPEVPAIVWEAFRRLAEYAAQRAGKAGARSESVSAGTVTLSHSRHEAWLGRAMQNSGAADLLRTFRRAA